MDKPNEYTTACAKETQKIAEDLAGSLSGGTVLALHGDLGSGKTTFVQGLAKGLGIKGQIISPTFIIVRTYKLDKARLNDLNHFYHIDLYRIEHENGLVGLGIEEIIHDPKNIVAIEWAERMGSLLPEKRIDIRFEYVDEGKRRIIIVQDQKSKIKDQSLAMEQEIERAVKIVNEGGLVIFPTDTAFGIGCRIDNNDAIKRLFTIRKRPETQATPVLVDTVKMAQEFVQHIPKDLIDKLIEPYWPGALTIILPCLTDKVPALVRGGGSTLGVRIPNHKTARAIIQGVGMPILGPSANFHGEATPYSFESVNKEIIKQVDFVVSGECTVKQASTVIDCSKTPWQIIRQGAVTIKL